MKIFGTLDLTLPTETNPLLLGRMVANANFIKALWKYGDFDQYHFFAADNGEENAFKKHQMQLMESYGIENKVKIFSRQDLFKHISETEYHVFHQSDPFSYFVNLCNVRSKYARVKFPVTCTTHSISYPAYFHSYLSMLILEPEKYDSIICTSNSGKSAIEEILYHLAAAPIFDPIANEILPKLRRDIIPLGIDINSFKPKPNLEMKKRLKKQFNIQEDATVLLCMGRFSLSDKYDVFPLFQALSLLFRESDTAVANTLKKTVLILAGARQQDAYPEMLQQIAQALNLANNVKILTDIPKELQYELYQVADIFISPSDNLQETFGLTVLEAMSSGLPVICSDWDGYKDLVEDGVTGFRIPTYAGGLWESDFADLALISGQRSWHFWIAQATAMDINPFVQTLKNLILSPETCIEMGEFAREKATAFSWENVIKKHLNLWESLSNTAKMDKSSKDSASMFSIPPFTWFAKHPTRKILDHDWLYITPLGEDLLKNPNLIIAYSELVNLVNSNVVRHICSLARYGAIYRDTIQMISETHDITDSQASYQTSWALKMGYISLTSNQDEMF